MVLLAARAGEWTLSLIRVCALSVVGDEDCRSVVGEQKQVSLFKNHGQMKGDRLIADWMSPHQMVEA